MDMKKNEKKKDDIYMVSFGDLMFFVKAEDNENAINFITRKYGLHHLPFKAETIKIEN